MSEYLFSILDPRHFVPFSCYNTARHRFHTITDRDTVTRLVENIGLDDDGTWDLVCLEGTKRDLLLAEGHRDSREHYQHVLYLTEDVNNRHRRANREFPSQSLPCSCVELSYMRKPDDDEIEWAKHRWRKHRDICQEHHYYPSHRGGEVVFARRRLQDTPFANELDRFWMDWVGSLTSCFFFCSLLHANIRSQNDCMLIMGSGDDGYSNLSHDKTVYILETLPGIKARALKRAVANPQNRPLALASACLFFNLKLEHCKEIEKNRDCLGNIMGPRYRPHFNDFAYMIDSSEFNFDNPEFLGLGSYGATYKVPWKNTILYDGNGDISYGWGHAVIKIVANSCNESSSERSRLFCAKVKNSSLRTLSPAPQV